MPGLLEGVLAAHARFGALPLAEVVRAAVAAVRESEPDDATRARLKLLLQLHRTGIHALERLGVLQSVLQTVGPVAGGVFTRDDLVPRAAPVRALATCLDGPDELLLPPRRSGRYGATPPDPLPALRVDGALAMDRHGVVAAAAWVVSPAAVGLEGVEGFALPALVPRARKGVARWRPGEPLPVPLPLAVMLHEGRAWGAVALSGAGDLVAARDAVVTARLAQAGIALPVGEGDGEGGAFARDTVAMWALRDADGDGARATMTAVETA